MMDFLNGIVDAITNQQPGNLVPVLIGLCITLGLIYYFKGRFWAFLYFATIPFLNWSFGVIDSMTLVSPNETFQNGIELHPLTMVTGLVFVFRDFVQRRMGHYVLIVMALAIGWSFYYAWPVIALASGLAFAVSEIADWLIFTFTRYRLSTRIILSSAVAAPIDTTIFLYGADLARQIRLGDEPGNMLHWANWIVFIIGKMVGAVIVSWLIRRREDAGKVDPYDDDGFSPASSPAPAD
ncbi:VUT family protein [Henriciella litoralis]|uniref:VUT family protein n=1 Tax=Henriciella litoralis TaxID=568102 RepID=UPI000A0586BE|nr:VUT family protein [Henriciella litoralis]